MSLFIRLQRFPGEKGMGADPPNPFEVTLIDFPTTPEEVDEVLDTIQTWLNEVGLETVTVHAEGRAYELHATPGSQVGRFAEWVMVRLGPGAGADEVFTTVGVSLVGESAGWAVARTRKVAAAELANRLMIETGQPVMSGWIYDSDFAYLAGSSQDGSSFEVLLGEPYETDGAEDEEYEELERLSSPAGQLESANALSAWSETNTPKSVPPRAAHRIIEEQPVFIEEALAHLLAELGLPGIASILDEL